MGRVSASPPPDVDPVAALWREVRPRQVASAHQLARELAAASADPTDREVWATCRDLAHRLAGTLGSFGQVAAGDAAVAIEDLIAGTEVADPAVLPRVRDLADRLVEELDPEAR